AGISWRGTGGCGATRSQLRYNARGARRRIDAVYPRRAHLHGYRLKHMSTVLSVENVSKTFRLGDIGGGTLKEEFARWWAKRRGNPDPLSKITDQDHARRIGDLFLALDNVSFEVKQGEVLGIIGRNGAGKSTLLKILSQVTAPSSGRIRIRGRIASLLEVGTG